MSTKRILDKAIKTVDFAGFVLKKKNGYELGVNSYHKLYIAFPGESMNNPHMLLGEDNPSNRSRAEKMFEEFANLKSKSVDASFKKGDTFKNVNGAIMKVLDPTKEGHMQVQSGNRVFLTTPESFQNMLTKNGYRKV